MSNDYHDAVDDAKLEAAARGVLRQALAECPMPVEALAARTVTDIFCLCVTDAEDACEGGLSAIHSGLIREVVKRVQAVIARSPPPPVFPGGTARQRPGSGQG